MTAIVTVPNPVLRAPTKPITHLDKRVLDIIEHMTSALKNAKDPEGVGLAAPQIGISLRIFLMRPLPDKTITVFINPEITKFSQRQQSPTKNKGVYEGCLSLPNHYAPVTRAMSVTVRYETPAKPGQSETKLVEKTSTFSGFPAHIIQHELDHLNGILFVDRVLEQNIPLYKVHGKTWTKLSL